MRQCVIFCHMGDKPPNRATIKQRIHAVLNSPSGIVDFSRHARVEMAKDGLETTDCINVLRGGVVQPAEYIDGTWRCRVTTARMCFVITVPEGDEIRVVTAWRDK